MGQFAVTAAGMGRGISGSMDVLSHKIGIVREQIATLNAQMAKLGTTSKTIKSGGSGSTVVHDPLEKVASKRRDAFWGTAPGHMIRYGGVYGGAAAMYSAAKHALVQSESAKTVDHSLVQANMGIKRDAILKNEWAARDFVTANPGLASTDEYLKAMTEVASSMDFGKLYDKNADQAHKSLHSLTQTIISLAKASKVGTEEYGNMLSKMTQQSINQMPLEEQRKYKTGEASIGELAMKHANMINALANSTVLWGKDFTHFAKNLMPVTSAYKGSVDQSAAIFAGLVNVGQDRSTAATGEAFWLNQGAKKALFNLELMQDPQQKDAFENMPKPIQKAWRRERGARLFEEYMKDQIAGEEKITRWHEKAVENFGPSAPDQLGLTERWKKQYMLKRSPGFAANARESLATIEAGKEVTLNDTLQRQNAGIGQDAQQQKIGEQASAAWRSFEQYSQQSEAITTASSAMGDALKSTSDAFRGLQTPAEAVTAIAWAMATAWGALGDVLLKGLKATVQATAQAVGEFGRDNIVVPAADLIQQGFDKVFQHLDYMHAGGMQLDEIQFEPYVPESEESVWNADDIARGIVDALTNAEKQGVDVNITFDPAGAEILIKNIMAKDKAASGGGFGTAY
jgi:hypothetical protein